MSRFAPWILAAAAAALLQAGPAGAAPKKKTVKEKIRAAVRFDEPRWQVSMLSDFIIFYDYNNFLRNGRGVSLCGLFRITRAVSVAAEAGYVVFGHARKAPDDYIETKGTQTTRLKGLVRYDLDIIELHPYVALGGSLYVFTTGDLHGFDPFHYGIDVEVGLDYVLAERILFGLVFGWGWILKYAPPPGNDYPTFMQIAIKMGGVL